MDPFEESGLRFLPPTEACFRFSGFRSYQRLSGRQLSEMDVGYWDEGRRSIILIELKDYATREPSRELIPKLVAKGRDCLLILHAAWSELSDAARAIASELPEVCRQRQRVRMFFVLKVGGIKPLSSSSSRRRRRLERPSSPPGSCL